MQDIGLDIGNVVLSFVGAFLLVCVSLLLMFGYSFIVAWETRSGAWGALGFMVYVGLPHALLSAAASFVIFYSRTSHP
jgi:hypothetical protein